MYTPSTYRQIKNFAPNLKSLEVDNPLSYCLGNTLDMRFNHGGGNIDIYGCHSRPCQAFMSAYCAQGWDGFCEYASNNMSKSYPNQLQPVNSTYSNLTSGQILIRNTAIKKYMKSISGCSLKVEPFDPSVPTSPMISFWEPAGCADGGGECALGSANCVPVYDIADVRGIDADPVMNKLLMYPSIGFDILVGIYKTMKHENRLSTIRGTKLAAFFTVLASKGY